MKTLIVEDFNLTYTMECGQFFRYELVDGWYFVHVRDELLKIRQIEDKHHSILEFKGSKNVDKRFVKRLFRLDDDLENIKRRI